MGDPAFAEKVGPLDGFDRLGVDAADRQGREVELLGLAEYVSAARTRPLDGEGGRVESDMMSDTHDRVPDEGGGPSVEFGGGEFEVRELLGCVRAETERVEQPHWSSSRNGPCRGRY